MKVISKFQDYYDNVQGFGQDSSLVFKRFKVESLISKENSPLRGLRRLSSQELFTNFSELPFRIIYVRYFSLIVCGKLYNGIRLEYYKEYEIKPLVESFYNLEAIKRFLIAQGGKEKELDKLEKKRRDYDKSFFFDRVHPEVFLMNLEKDRLREWAIDNKIVLCSWEQAGPEFSSDTTKILQRTNPCLKDYDFIKVLSPFEIYQEISMFLGGVLTPESKPMIEIEDKYKISEHGFDKWSFRTKSP